MGKKFRPLRKREKKMIMLSTTVEEAIAKAYKLGFVRGRIAGAEVIAQKQGGER